MLKLHIFLLMKISCFIQTLCKMDTRGCSGFDIYNNAIELSIHIFIPVKSESSYICLESVACKSTLRDKFLKRDVLEVEAHAAKKLRF